MTSFTKVKFLPPASSPDAADFDTDGFFAKKGVRRANCYSASMLDCSGREGHKRQPGETSGMPGLYNVGPKACPALVSRVIRDNPNGVYLSDPSEQCASGHYKVMMFAGNSADGMSSDYHFWRQARNVRIRIKEQESVNSMAERFGVNPSQVQAPHDPMLPGDVVRVCNAHVFVSKPGLTAQVMYDSCGKVIKDPRTACRQGGNINYTQLCSSFCVKRPKDAYRMG